MRPFNHPMYIAGEAELTSRRRSPSSSGPGNTGFPENGYYNSQCEDSCNVGEERLADPEYRRGWDAGRIDFRRAQR